MSTAVFDAKTEVSHYRVPQFHIGGVLPDTAWQPTLGYKIANNAATVVPYLWDVNAHVWGRFGTITITDSVDPTTYADADIANGDIWVDTTTAATPTVKIRVAGAWNTIA